MKYYLPFIPFILLILSVIILPFGFEGQNTWPNSFTPDAWDTEHITGTIIIDICIFFFISTFIAIAIIGTREKFFKYDIPAFFKDLFKTHKDQKIVKRIFKIIKDDFNLSNFDTEKNYHYPRYKLIKNTIIVTEHCIMMDKDILDISEPLRYNITNFFIKKLKIQESIKINIEDKKRLSKLETIKENSTIYTIEI